MFGLPVLPKVGLRKSFNAVSSRAVASKEERDNNELLEYLLSLVLHRTCLTEPYYAHLSSFVAQSARIKKSSRDEHPIHPMYTSKMLCTDASSYMPPKYTRKV